MKKVFLVLVLVFLSNKTYSQKKFSFELSYPITVSNNFVDETIAVGAGVKYAIKQSDDFTFGMAYNIDLVNGNTSFSNTDLDRNRIYNHLDAYGEFALSSIKELHFIVNAGYSHVISKNEFINGNPEGDTIENNNKNSSGFNFAIGTSYDISDSIFLLLNYRFINRFEKSELDGNTKSFNSSLINIGAGIRF